MPASTGTTAPVTPLDAGPHSQTTAAATSSGSSSRGSRWWTLNSSGSVEAVESGAGGEGVGSGRTRRDDVGRHALRPELGGKAAHETDDTVLCRHVGAEEGQSDGSAGRCHRDEAACPRLRPLEQCRHSGPRQAPDAAQVDVDHRLPEVVACLPDRLARRRRRRRQRQRRRGRRNGRRPSRRLRRAPPARARRPPSRLRYPSRRGRCREPLSPRGRRGRPSGTGERDHRRTRRWRRPASRRRKAPLPPPHRCPGQRL